MSARQNKSYHIGDAKVKGIKVELGVAIPAGYGGCIFGIISPSENKEIKKDCDEWGGELQDFFNEGTSIPTKAGIYIFKGIAYGDSEDGFHRYQGRFVKQKWGVGKVQNEK